MKYFFLLSLFFATYLNAASYGCKENSKAAYGYYDARKGTRLYKEDSAKSPKIKVIDLESQYQFRAKCENELWIQGQIVRSGYYAVNGETGWIKKSDLLNKFAAPNKAISKAQSDEDCIANGIGYYKTIGSYPRLSNGKDISQVVQDKCTRTRSAFDPLD